ncbi:glycosyltransferase family 2 protein [Patescibacteria group bacterium]|nr:glycosyltransferase family 2 protein [Patescibacteria group bacterium]
MKLFVQIPCYNEEETLPLVIRSIPREIAGIERVEIIVIDDGSTDRTAQVARELGVEHILKHRTNKGLAQSFEDGLNYALLQGADIIVNTDGDNQYPQSEIPRLIEPIMKGEADIVIANRQTDKISHFSWKKKMLQKLGSGTVRIISRVKLPDAPSGFRAYSREAALHMNIVTNFSYVIETIIQASKKGFKIVSIPVITNPQTRKSRLFKSNWEHIKKSGSTLVRVYMVYEPFKAFFYLGSLIFGAGFILGLRFLYFYFFVNGGRTGHVQSLILAAVLLMIGFQVFVLGVIADLIGINRRLVEKLLYQDKKSM